MIIGLISDTHGYFDPQIPSLFAGVQHILHAGDIGGQRIIDELRAIAPVTAVLGNNDYDPSYQDTQVVELNGQRVKRPWGRSSWQLAPGPYVLRVGFNYIFGPMGWGQRQIMIYPGQTTALRYSAPAIIFLSGELFEVMPQQLPALRR